MSEFNKRNQKEASKDRLAKHPRQHQRKMCQICQIAKIVRTSFFVNIICKTILKTIVISDEFFWSDYQHPQADKVDIDSLVGLFDSDKFKGFQYNPSGALIFRQVQDGSESFEILSVTESSDAVCELSVGKRDDAGSKKKYLGDQSCFS